MDPRQLLNDTQARLRSLLASTQSNQRQIGGALRAALQAYGAKMREADAARAAERKQVQPYQPPPPPEAPAPAPVPQAAPASPSAASGMQFTAADEKSSIGAAVAVGVEIAAAIYLIGDLPERSSERATDNDFSL